jgi:hypothetical protein
VIVSASPSDLAAQTGYLASVYRETLSPAPAAQTVSASTDGDPLQDQPRPAFPTIAALAPDPTAATFTDMKSPPLPPMRPSSLVSKSSGKATLAGGMKASRTKVAAATSGAKRARQYTTPLALARSAASSLARVAQGIGKIPYRVSLLFR